MALNPCLAEDCSGKLFPLPLPGEIFFLKRENIRFRLKGPGATLKGSGCFFLSSRRIVFLKSGKVEQHGTFSSCELPLHLVPRAQFKQPIFGANYLEGTVNPKQDAENPLQGTSTWSLTFNAGGCGTFINVFFRLWKSCLNHQQPDSSLVQQLQFGSGAAFVDPNDPSVVYVTQPQPAGQQQQQQPLAYPYPHQQQPQQWQQQPQQWQQQQQQTSQWQQQPSRDHQQPQQQAFHWQHQQQHQYPSYGQMPSVTCQQIQQQQQPQQQLPPYCQPQPEQPPQQSACQQPQQRQSLEHEQPQFPEQLQPQVPQQSQPHRSQSPEQQQPFQTPRFPDGSLI